MDRKVKKILAVASSGGHWTQLILVQEAFVGQNVTYLTTSINQATERRLKGSALLKVKQANFNQKFRMAILAFQVLFHVLSTKPDIVISTGAAPGFFAVLFGKIIGAKTIWLDSVANYARPSLSGTKIQPFCDQFLTQWPHLSPPATFLGKVL